MEDILKYEKLYYDSGLREKRDILQTLKSKVAQFKKLFSQNKTNQTQTNLIKILQLNAALQNDYITLTQTQKRKIEQKTDQMLKKQKEQQILSKVNAFQEKWKMFKQKFKSITQKVIDSTQKEVKIAQYFFLYMKDTIVPGLLRINTFQENFKKWDFTFESAPEIHIATFSKALSSYRKLQTQGYFQVDGIDNTFKRLNTQFKTDISQYFKNLKQLKTTIMFEISDQDNKNILANIDCCKFLINIMVNFSSNYEPQISPQFFMRLMEKLLQKSMEITKINAKYYFYFQKNSLYKNQINIYLQFYILFLVIGIGLMRELIWTVICQIGRKKSFASFSQYQKFMVNIDSQKNSQKKSQAVILSQYVFCLQKTKMFSILENFFFKQVFNSHNSKNKQIIEKIKTKQFKIQQKMFLNEKTRLSNNLKGQISKHQLLSKVLLNILSQLQTQSKDYLWKRVNNKIDIFKNSYYLKKIQRLFQTYTLDPQQVSFYMTQQFKKISFFANQQQKIKFEIYLEYHSRIKTQYPSANRILKIDENIDLSSLSNQSIQNYISSYLFGEGITLYTTMNYLNNTFQFMDKHFSKYLTKQTQQLKTLPRNYMVQFLYNKLNNQTKNILQILNLEQDFKRQVFAKQLKKFQIKNIMRGFLDIYKKIPANIRNNQEVLNKYLNDFQNILKFLWENHSAKMQTTDYPSEKQFETNQEKLFIQNLKAIYQNVLMNLSDNKIEPKKIQTFKQQIPIQIKSTNQLYIQRFVKFAKTSNLQTLRKIYQDIQNEEKKISNILTQNKEERQKIKQIIQKGKIQKTLLSNYMTQFNKQLTIAQQHKYNQFLKKKQEQEINIVKNLLMQIVGQAKQKRKNSRRFDTNQQGKVQILQSLLITILQKNPQQRLENILYNFIKNVSTGVIDKDLLEKQNFYKPKSQVQSWNVFDKVYQSDFVKNIIGLVMNIFSENSYYLKTMKQVKNIKEIIQQLTIQRFYLRNNQRNKQEDSLLEKVQQQIIFMNKRLKLIQKIQQQAKQDIKHFFQSINLSGYISQKSFDMLQKSASLNNEMFKNIFDIMKNNKIQPKKSSPKQQVIKAYNILKQNIQTKTNEMIRASSNLDRMSIIIDKQYNQNLQFLKNIEDQQLRLEIQTKFRNNFIRKRQQQLHINKAIQKTQVLWKQIQCFLRGMMTKKFFFQYIQDCVNKVQQSFQNLYTKYKGTYFGDFVMCAQGIFKNIQIMLKQANKQGQESYEQCRNIIKKQDIQHIIKKGITTNIKDPLLVEEFWKKYKGYK